MDTAPASSMSMVRLASPGDVSMDSWLTSSVVEFRMIVFRPFKGEVMLGKIRSSTVNGINIRTEFFDEIFVPYSELPAGAE